MTDKEFVPQDYSKCLEFLTNLDQKQVQLLLNDLEMSAEDVYIVIKKMHVDMDSYNDSLMTLMNSQYFGNMMENFSNLGLNKDNFDAIVSENVPNDEKTEDNSSVFNEALAFLTGLDEDKLGLFLTDIEKTPQEAFEIIKNMYLNKSAYKDMMMQLMNSQFFPDIMRNFSLVLQLNNYNFCEKLNSHLHDVSALGLVNNNERKVEIAAEAKEQAEAEAKEQAETEAKEQAEAEAKEQAEAEAKEQVETEAKEQAETEAKEQAEAEAKEQAEAEAKKKLLKKFLRSLQGLAAFTLLKNLTGFDNNKCSQLAKETNLNSREILQHIANIFDEQIAENKRRKSMQILERSEVCQELIGVISTRTAESDIYAVIAEVKKEGIPKTKAEVEAKSKVDSKIKPNNVKDPIEQSKISTSQMSKVKLVYEVPDVRQEFVSLFGQLLKKMRAITSTNFYVVNAGRMNHGKSSMFNALADAKEFFKTGDIRTTVEQNEKYFKNDIYFVDTPGLDANESDDSVAFKAYRKADLILFVHTPNVGELHKNEIDRINQIATLFPSKKEFWKRFVLVFTFKEATKSEDFSVIYNKISKDIKQYCGGEGFPWFRISNLDYWDGIEKHDSELVKVSGILELRNFIESRAAELGIGTLREAKIEKLKKEFIEKLNAEKEMLVKKIAVNRDEIQKGQNDVNVLLKDVKTKQKEYDSFVRDSNQEIEHMRANLSRMEQQHSDERSRYW